MGKPGLVLLMSVILGSAAVAQDDEPIPMQEYTNQLLESYGPDSLVTGAEVYGTTKDQSETFYKAVGAALTAFSTTPAPQPAGSRCTFPPLDSPWEGNFWRVWCAARSGAPAGFEAQRDTYVSQAGRPPLYYYSQFYDCQNPSDKAAMTEKVRNALC